MELFISPVQTAGWTFLRVTGHENSNQHSFSSQTLPLRLNLLCFLGSQHSSLSWGSEEGVMTLKYIHMCLCEFMSPQEI